MQRLGYVIAFWALVGALSTAAQADWQHTRWGMSRAELEKTNGGPLLQVSPETLFPKDTKIAGGGRGSALDVRAQQSLLFRYAAQGMTYQSLYHLNNDRLIMITLVPQSIRDGIETERLLEKIYGSPETIVRSGLEVGTSGCIVRKQWRSASEGNLITFFNKCGSRFELRYEPVPTRTGL